MTNYYVTDGIDQRKLSEDAMKISKDGTLVVIHYHSHEGRCNDVRHDVYREGRRNFDFEFSVA